MPLIDLPLAQLYTYEGLNPRPADYDAYWAEALRELDATDPEPELVPSDAIRPPHAECFDLWFRGVGGARLYAKYLRPKHAPAPGPAVAGPWAQPAPGDLPAQMIGLMTASHAVMANLQVIRRADEAMRALVEPR